MRILYYIHALYVGGAETIVVNNLLKLSEQGHETFLVVNELKKTFLEEKVQKAGIKVKALWPEESKNLIGKIINGIRVRSMNYRNVWRNIIENIQPDIIHIHTFLDMFEPDGIALDRVFYTFHSNVERNLRMGSELHKKKLREYSNAGMTFFALSSKMKLDISNALGTRKIIVIPNGVNIKAIQSQKIDKSVFCSKNAIPRDSYIVGHVGRFNPVKNHTKLFDIFSCIRKKNDNAYLILVGTGSKKEKQGIDNLIDKYNLRNYVRLLGLRKDAVALMSAFDAFVLTSLSESFSLVLIEAQAQNIRCVTSDVVPEEVICTKKCFSLSIDDDSERWASLILDSNERETVKYDINAFSIEKVIEDTIAAYNKSLGSGEFIR